MDAERRLAELTGREDGPPLAPADGVIERMLALGPLERLVERAALAGHRRRSPVSAGGVTHLLPTAEGWLAVSLARPADIESVPAWLELERVADDPWATVAAAAAVRRAAPLVRRARLLGMAAATVGEVAAPDQPTVDARLVDREPLGRPPVVVELASLWAGPLCADLLRRGGAQVIKVESASRPDGARLDRSGFFEHLNEGKDHLSIDLGSPAGGAQLHLLLRGADVVVEGSRPRALQQLGIDAEALVRDGGPRVWVSITGHGRTGPPADWIGFGDDAAVAGGLVVEDDAGPCFVADAVADPLAGLAAAAAAQRALAAGGGWLLDVALSRVAAWVAAGA